MKFRSNTSFLVELTAILLWSLTTVPPAAAQEQEKPAEAKEESSEAGKDGEDKKEGDKDAEKPFDEVVKDMEKIEGLFTFYRNADDNKTLVELTPDQFNTDYLYSSKIEQATGERGLYGTIMRDYFIVQWRRLGKRVQFVRKNIRFRAAPDSPAARAIENSFSDSILASGKIQSKPHFDSGSILVDLHEVFATRDLDRVGEHLKRVYKTGYKFDKDDSGIVFLKSFPKNSEIGVRTQFWAEEQKQRSVTLPNALSLTLQMRYSLVALPEEAFMPRLGDDRVGHFYDTHMDFTSDKPDTPYVRYVRRWKLEKKDPDAKVSEPKEPIVFWLENSIPHEYRDWIRDGALTWNPAFERIGFKNAIVVKQQSDDADWDPADIRYNTIRWFVSYDRSFAIGPSHSNPYTGQQIDADIGLSEAMMRIAARRRYELSVHPVQRLERLKASTEAPSFIGEVRPELCDYGSFLLDASTFGYEVLAARPDWDPAKEEKYLRQFAIWVVSHEVGHTLGFRHNFRASTVNRMDQLTDTKRGKAVGLAASVMDYSPPVVALPGEKQGDYFQEVVGSYDQWAVEYAYKPIPGAKTPQDEVAELRKIGARVADPLLLYATDEDAGLGARALDPRNNRFDFTDQPLDWFETRLKLVDELWSKMESKLVREGDSYEVLRRSFGGSLTDYFVGSHVAMKFIGGIYHNRDHAGDPGGRLPYRPVPAEEQRKALKFLRDKIWAADVFDVPAGLLVKLQFGRFPDFEGRQSRAKRLDFPIHEVVLSVQGSVLDELYNPVKLGRLQDLELLADPADRFTMADAFVGVREAIWSELDNESSINGFRRNLQGKHLEHLMKLVLRPPKDMPGDAVALARADLAQLQTGIDQTLRSGQLDYTTRAHLENVAAKIRQTLEARVEQQLVREEPKKE